MSNESLHNLLKVNFLQVDVFRVKGHAGCNWVKFSMVLGKGFLVAKFAVLSLVNSLEKCSKCIPM